MINHLNKGVQMMSFLKSTHTTKTCPKTGKIIEESHKSRWFWWFLPFTGLFALIWFLIRVIPKPSRATYPCQRVAFPIASGFIVWILGLAGSAVAYRKAKLAFARARYVVAAIAIIASVAFIWAALSNTDLRTVFAADDPTPANAPVGTARGIHPGRVVWIHDANATSWPGADGNQNQPYWHSDTCTNQQVVSQMLSKALRSLAGESTDYAAWDAIFRNFNQQHGRGNVGYTPGEKIAIKINFVLMNTNPADGNKPIGNIDQIDDSPQLVMALLKQLTNVVGVEPCNISIGDPSMEMPNHWYYMVGPNCPGVVYLTKDLYTFPGRTRVTPDYNAPFYWSDPTTSRTAGKTQDYIPTHFSKATYFIDFPVLKSHNDAGVTLCGKNHFGSLRIPTAPGYYDMHATRATETPGMGHYRGNVDLMGHPKLGGKTMLALIDGLYSGRSWDSHTIKWQMAPFNNDWPSSIFLSQDQVAADSVAFDFMFHEWVPPITTLDGLPHKSGAHDYMHEAALVPDPPSDTNYDPNHDGGLTESLGVHEHWNDANNKQYSRNLDPINGTGIQLVNDQYLPGDFQPDGNVDFKDFAVLAAAWGSRPGDDNWNTNCDISIPHDSVIDINDLIVFCNNWLQKPVTDLISPGATLQELYSASTQFEGATWDPNSHKLFFTKRTSTFQILRYESPGNVTVWQNPSSETNGMIISLDGRLLVCDENPRRISSYRIDPCGPADLQVLADTSDGFTQKPNDLCQLTNGNIYFTTPDWGGSLPSAQGVWLLKPNGTVTQVSNTLNQPNGIITSLDETKLYVSEGSSTAANQRWTVFNINSDGSLGSPTLFFKPTNPPNTTNIPDGMTIDELGNLYFCGLGGVWIVSPAGQQLGFISVANPFNIAFGGNDGRTLYITTGNGKLYSLAMCVRGGESTSW
jgi:sugar lactone lactonase YvrE